MMETTRPVPKEEAVAILRDSPRVCFVRAADGVQALNSTIEMMRDLGRPRGDLWEVAVWEDALTSDGNELFLVYQVHNEAIVVPETIDAIRAMTRLQTNGLASIAKTDAALGIRRDFLKRAAGI